MSWLEVAWEWLRNFLTHPLPIIGVSVGTILIIVWKVLKVSSFGKKAIASMNSKCDDYKAEVITLRSEIQKKDEEIDRLISENRRIASERFDEFANREELIIKALSYINNVKVKEVVKEYGERKNG